MHPFHHERLAAVQVSEVGDRLWDPYARLACGEEDVVLLSEGERVEVDHASAGATDE
jgi:hypothetical protein